MRRIGLILSVVAIGIAIGGYVFFNGERKPPIRYRTAAVERGEIVSVVSATGTINPVVSVQVGTQVSGMIKSLHADFNSRVKAGDTVAVERPGAPVQTVTSFPDPFAGHAPKHVARSPEPEPVAEVVEVASAASASAAAAPATDPFAGLSAEDADVHRKAQRFARLLVDEIKLYNQAKVSEGRRNKDLYDRLKEDIEKSRVTFQKRYGNTAAASGDYFQKEVLRSLAEDDLSVMGANFRR